MSVLAAPLVNAIRYEGMPLGRTSETHAKRCCETIIDLH